MPTEPSKQELAAARAWRKRAENATFDSTDDYERQLAMLIHKHMTVLSAKTVVSEIHDITLRDVDFGPDEQLNKIIAIIERTGRTVSDANTKE